MTTSRLIDRTALVTGATSGIGAAIARTLAAEGAHVLISGRHHDRGQAGVGHIRSTGGRADFLGVDLSGPHENIRAFAAAATSLLGGRVDVLVNNAGVYPSPATTDLSDTDLDVLLAVNVRAPYVLTAALIPPMVERGRGVVINIGSWMAQVGSPFGAMYTATKAADEQLTRSWAAEYGPRGVRVNTVAPGVTLTPGNAEFETVLHAMATNTPAGSVITPADIAAAVAFLASDDAARIHGITLHVDGGISATKLV
ncbi:SDR family NAD(P)-dependent oxidoreductase [Frankia gtarii]|uniref:SDR family NAD(P)-dependent oxidoreductase n=1 Tax=Frankia gtarii TaxID=2950102 RepID=UPI0021BE1975|nr:SDR family oxidoreductase [Frankia gtarii]